MGQDFAEMARIEIGLLANRPSLETITDGDWVWRFAQGYTGRANSLQCHNKNDVANFLPRLGVHWARSHQKGIAAQFRVTPLTPLAIVKHLQEQGFSRFGNTKVMVLARAKTVDVSKTIHKISLHKAQDQTWQNDILWLEQVGKPHKKTFVQMLEELPANSIGLRLKNENQETIGAAYASCVNGLGSVFVLIVDPGERGKGYGRAMMLTLQNWLISRGAKDIALQVVANNSAAISLYMSLGYEAVYDYYYLVEEK